jgi:hypothetical protein
LPFFVLIQTKGISPKPQIQRLKSQVIDLKNFKLSFLFFLLEFVPPWRDGICPAVAGWNFKNKELTHPEYYNNENSQIIIVK